MPAAVRVDPKTVFTAEAWAWRRTGGMETRAGYLAMLRVAAPA